MTRPSDGFEFATDPYDYQLAIFDRTAARPAWAHRWEQGAGKTKITLDVTARQHDAAVIDRLLVVAPNGVHFNWVADEIPKHVPTRCRHRALAWHPGRSKSKRWLGEFDGLLAHDGLKILAMSYSAIRGKRGEAIARKFLKGGDALMVLDEAHHAKTPGSATTKAVTRLGKLARSRRALSGTFASEGPFDLFAPIRFLDPDFWKRQRPSVGTYTAFKSYFGVWEKGHVRRGGKLREFPQLKGFRNLPKLREMLAQISDRVLIDDVQPDLPKQRFTRRSFELPDEWRRVYRELEARFEVMLHSGEMVTAEMALTRAMRLHQIACGYVATDDGADPVTDLPGANPRLDLLATLLEDAGHQAIVWATFRRDVDKIVDLLGDRCVRYDGAVNPDDRERARAAMKAGDAQFFVANPAAAGEGLTILVPTMIYYSLGYKARLRSQSLARNRRPGAERWTSLEVIDLVAQGTVDERCIAALNRKRDAAAEIEGDDLTRLILPWNAATA